MRFVALAIQPGHGHHGAMHTGIPELESIHVEEAPLLSRLMRCKRGDGAVMFMEPGAIIEVRTNWAQVISPEWPGVHNAVLRCKLDVDAADRAIARVVAAADARRAPMRWLVGPTTTPSDIPERISRVGFQHTGDVLAMVARPAEITARVRDGIVVREVDEAELDTWARVAVVAFGDPPEFEPRLLAEARHVVTHRLGTRYFLATIDGEPAGTAALANIPAGGYFMGGAVLPAFRRRGVYEALLAARATALQEDGALAAVVHASVETSAPICARYGLREVGRLSWFRRPAP